MDPTPLATNDAILAAILETLQRLEHRLNTHEQLIGGNKRDGITSVVDNDVPPGGHPMQASELMRSLADLHRRFDFVDDGSEHQSIEGTDPKNDRGECYSISIYPSRPLSRLDMNEVDSDADCPSGADREVDTLPTTPPSLRYEQLPVLPPKSPLRQFGRGSTDDEFDNRQNDSDGGQSHVSSGSGRRSPRRFKSLDLPRRLTAKKLSMNRIRVRSRGAGTGSSDSNSFTSSTDSDINPSSPSGSALSKQSMASIFTVLSSNAGKVSGNMKSSMMATSTALTSAAGRTSQQVKLSGLETAEWMRTRTKLCVGIVPRMASAAARATINQQFKRLDASL
ncbi:hypothetical protein QBC34DRAFT_444298 [Podospora aff. communis PSN243]|uniref:Uncharacterized protein n=1 Tax=Podospora aff. communis PSN243 TaxID=3040156 RepID=A0AAV9FZK6_9PEZI|nr:hypothetical protein QBC34DRAFT_444298 [Podospora aff. communis PSN243]